LAIRQHFPNTIAVMESPTTKGDIVRDSDNICPKAKGIFDDMEFGDFQNCDYGHRNPRNDKKGDA
jgi:hypothetical protein